MRAFRYRMMVYSVKKVCLPDLEAEKAPEVLREALPPHILIITADFYNKEYTR